MQMESGFDKSDNSISLRGPRRYGHELFKIFNHFVKAARCCLTLEEGECHMDQKIAKTLKWDEEGSGSCNNFYLMYCNFHTFFCLSLSGGYVESYNPKQDERQRERESERLLIIGLMPANNAVCWMNDWMNNHSLWNTWSILYVSCSIWLHFIKIIHNDLTDHLTIPTIHNMLFLFKKDVTTGW